MPLQATSGAASYDAFGGGVPVVPNYIEDVFSTYLYTGNDSSQTITNGIDLAGKGGLVWIKDRTANNNNGIWDSNRGAGTGSGSTVNKVLVTRDSGPEGYGSTVGYVSSFNSTGFSVVHAGSTATSGSAITNLGTSNYVSWTFRKQPKFIDIVTFTGTGTNTTFSHNLGSTPAFIIVKRTSGVGGWNCWTPNLGGNDKFIRLDSTGAVSTDIDYWNNSAPTSTVFSVGGGNNISGSTYVAYLFASNAGGFGLTGTDNAITCGTYSVDAVQTQVTVNIGYEPQWLLIKRATGGTGAWYLFDNMRGITTGGDDNQLQANSAGSEAALGPTDAISLTSTGFQTGTNATVLQPSSTYIYIAIRRGPMKVPTSGTSVFDVSTAMTGTVKPAFNSGILVDMGIQRRPAFTQDWHIASRLTGTNNLYTNLTDAEVSQVENTWNYMTGWGSWDVDNSDYRAWNFRRAPSFFDEVCYTGTGTAMTVAHNLGVAPEMMIVKNRSNATSWAVYSPIGATKVLTLNTTNAETTFSGSWNNTAPTSSVFTVGNSTGTNQSGSSMVAYLFATCAGVSKVTSFTGNGGSQTINCGFTAGSRFVMIKRTDSTGDWYVWDSARGIVSGNDPHLSLNSTAAEVTTDDTIDTDSTGFIVNQVSATNCNVNGASYIVLAIA